MIEYDKLIRDRIPEIIEANGKSCEVEVMDDDEYIEYLKKKLQEEVEEFLESGEKEEIADILEVIYAIIETKGLSQEEIEAIREKKAENRGRFARKLRLVRVNS